jgi:GTP pyrophosphokinase
MDASERKRLTDAVDFAAEVHASQTRKGGGGQAPYVCHLLVVAGLVLEHGGSLDAAIAGLLHDALEDSDEVTPEVLEARFGAEVARIVQDCTDTLPGDTAAEKSPWKERKERYLEHLSEASAESVLVSACDKRHNLGAMVGELRATGLGTLEGFKGSPQEQVWFYREVARRVLGRVPNRLQLELEALVDELEVLIQATSTRRWSAGEPQ